MYDEMIKQPSGTSLRSSERGLKYVKLLQLKMVTLSLRSSERGLKSLLRVYC